MRSFKVFNGFYSDKLELSDFFKTMMDEIERDEIIVFFGVVEFLSTFKFSRELNKISHEHKSANTSSSEEKPEKK